MSKLDEAAILLSARHSDISSTATYLGDSATMKALMDRTNPDDPRQRVGKWESIHISTLESFSTLNIESSKYTKPLPELASWFVYDILGISKSNKHVSFAQIHRTACAYTPDLTHEQKMKAILESKLSPQELAEVLALYKQGTNERIRAAMNPSSVATVSDSTPSTEAPQNESQSVEPFIIDAPSKKRKQNVDDRVSCERDFQLECKKAREKPAKVKVCIDCDEQVRLQITQGKVLVDPLRTFAYRAAKVAQCVKECHGSSIESFLESNPSFTPSNFGTCSKDVKHAGCFDSAQI
jgi:hypothetical protein